MHDSVYDLAGDDPRIAKSLRASLTKLAEGPDGLLKEMAEGVLHGEIDLRQAALSEAYGNEIGVALDKFTVYYDTLDQDERNALAGQAEEQLDILLDGPATLSRSPQE